MFRLRAMRSLLLHELLASVSEPADQGLRQQPAGGLQHAGLLWAAARCWLRPTTVSACHGGFALAESIMQLAAACAAALWQWPSTFSKAGGMLQSDSANLSCSFARKGAGLPPPPTAQMRGHTRFCSPVSLLFVGQGKAAALRHLILTTYPTLV